MRLPRMCAWFQMAFIENARGYQTTRTEVCVHTYFIMVAKSKGSVSRKKESDYLCVDIH